MRVSSSIRRPSSNGPARFKSSRVNESHRNAVALPRPQATAPTGSRSRGTRSPSLLNDADSLPQQRSQRPHDRLCELRLCS